MIALALLGCAGVNQIQALEGAPRALDEVESALWTDGPWYDTGEVAFLILSSGAVSCEELQDIGLQTDEYSTVFQDEGLLAVLRRDWIEEGAAALSWEGLWTGAGYEGGWEWELTGYVFHDGQTTEAPAGDTWLQIDRYDEGGDVEGELMAGWYSARLALEHCGELRTYILY